MSVIFQTLKKLKQQQADPQVPGAGKTRRRKPAFTEQLLRTPLAMGIVIGIIFLSGFLLLYGIDRFSSSSQVASVSVHRTVAEKRSVARSVPVEHQKHAEKPQIARETVAEEKMPPVDFLQAQEPSLTEYSTSATYYPPRDLSPTFLPASDKSIETSIEIAPQYSAPVQVAAGAVMPDQSVVSNEKEKNSEKKIDAVDKTATVVTQPLDSEQRERVANMEKFRRAAKKRAAVAKLVKQLENAMDRMDTPEVEKMLSRLSAAKGQDNLYVMNLKAFWYLKQEYFSEAESLLLEILNTDPDHLEAGLNQAVVEVRTGRVEAAIKRIRQLRELYPDNPELTDMIRKLQK